MKNLGMKNEPAIAMSRPGPPPPGGANFHKPNHHQAQATRTHPVFHAPPPRYATDNTHVDFEGEIGFDGDNH